MYILTTVEDVIPVEPIDFQKTSIDALRDNVNEKYANKIIQDVGLCICFFDLLHAEDGIIGHGRGAPYVKAEFRLVVFRPFKGEILEGVIHSASEAGMTISVDFFDDIFVPGPANIFHNCRYDKKEKVWVWENEGTELYFDKNERVRVRIEEEIWTDLAPSDQPLKTSQGTDAIPPGPRITKVSDEQGQTKGKVHQENLSQPQKKNLRAWRLIASMQQGGLGCVSWW